MRLTKRLLLREFEVSDVDPLFEIQGNLEWMKHTVATKSREECADWLGRYAASAPVNGFAPWTAVHREDHCVVGWGGLNIDPLDTRWGVEISYFMHPGYAGQGLATELVLEALRCANDELGLESVGAFAMPQNTGSVRVLLKAGFRLVGFERELERDYFVIDLNRS